MPPDVRLKCTKFDFGWGSPRPCWGAYSAPPYPLAEFEGLTFKKRGNGREGRGGEGKGKERRDGREGKERERREGKGGAGEGRDCPLSKILNTPLRTNAENFVKNCENESPLTGICGQRKIPNFDGLGLYSHISAPVNV